MKIKKVGIPLLLAASMLAASFSGCSSGSAQSTAPSGGQSAAPAASSSEAKSSEASAAVSSGSGKAVTISLWTGYPEEESWFKKMGDDYKAKHPNVSFEIASFPLRDFEKKVATSLPANSCADIISLNPNLGLRYIKENLIVKVPDDLSKFVTGGTYDKSIVNTAQYEGIVYSVPFMLGSASLYCNTKMFKEAGIAEAPKTMDELLEDAKKLTKYDSAGNITRSGFSLRLTGGGSGLAEKFWTLMMENNGSIIEEVSPQKYRAGYDNDAGLKTLQMYIDMVYKYRTDDFKIASDADGFETEKTAMFARETWVIGDIKKKAPNLEYFTAPMPGNADIAITEDLTVPSSVSQDPDKLAEVWNFIRFVMEPDNHKQLTSMSGWLPGGRSDLQMDDFFKENPQYKAFFTKYEKVNTTPLVEEFDEIETKLADRLANYGYTDKSFVDNPDKMKSFLHECAEETNEILKENGHLAE